MPNDENTLFVVVNSEVPRSQWDPEDQSAVALGLYEIRVSETVPEHLRVTAALDCFHVSITIACLDDFEISVISDPNDLGSVIVESEEGQSETYEHSREAEFCGYFGPLPSQTSEMTLTAHQQAQQSWILGKSAARDAYLFAAEFPGANIAALQKVVIQHGRGWDAYCFANNIAGADIAALQQVVIERGCGWDAHCFAKDVPGADLKALAKVVMDKGDGYAAYLFAKDVPGADIAALQQMVMDRGDNQDSFFFARDVPGANRAALRSRLVALEAADADEEGFLARFDAAFPEVAPTGLDDTLIPSAGPSAGVQPK